MKQTTIADSLRGYIEKYDRIFVIMDNEDDTGNLTYNFCRSKALRETTKNVLILSDKDILCIKGVKHQYQRLNENEMHFIRQIYFMYDFSDRFQVLSDNPQYGSILNYVKAGELTMEAVFQALLEP